MWQSSYDIIIVGAGIAGSALAHALCATPSSSTAKPLRVLLLERSFAEPDRIVGELLQPGGLATLRSLGLGDCVDAIDAVRVHGYAVVQAGEVVRVPYTEQHEGRSFHHGRFVQRLREKARAAPGVECVEAAVGGLLECPLTGRIIGVRARRTGSADKVDEPFYASLVVAADGCFSNLRAQAFKAPPQSKTLGHFVGLVLKDAPLPVPRHGTVCLVKGHGPVLLYQIAEEGRDTRMLVDVQAPLPADLKGHIATQILPQLPSSLHEPIRGALEADRLRRMPNTFLAPAEQGGHATKEGVLLLGDAWNMRHPLTGGGMTVALHDVAFLAPRLLALPDLRDWRAVGALCHEWHWARKPTAATVNILSVALYDLFGAQDENLAVLRDGCFAYFQRGGKCVDEPVELLSAVRPSIGTLVYHFFAVALYAIYLMFTRPVRVSGMDEKPVLRTPGVDEWPALGVKAVHVLWTAVVVFGPLAWSEVRWW